MAQFSDIPAEIIAIIARQLLRPHYLANVSQVNRPFHAYATPLLYERTSIFAWHRESKKKASNSRTVSMCKLI